MTETETVIRFRWGRGASLALQSDHRYVDLEGGIRAQKTTALCASFALHATRYPGIKQYLCRWTEDALDTQLKPAWRAYLSQCHIPFTWNAQEQYDQLPNGSIVYLRGLKSSDDSRRYGKIRGLTLARIGVDQAEEMPVDFWAELQGRLSQPNFPQQIWLTPQPVNDDHWIAKEFPADNLKRDYLYLRTNVYDNRENVGDAYIAELERIYPIGSAQRRTLLEGRRGLASQGTPVYAGYFSRQNHVQDGLQPVRGVPVIEGWDWGHAHPCVVWWQFTSLGGMLGLGAVMGEAMFLEDFAPAALAIRRRWFPDGMEFWSIGDPAGLDMTNQGTTVSKIREILADHGVFPTSQSNANQPAMRTQAIQTISRIMRRTTMNGTPAFQMNPRAIVVNKDGEQARSFLADGFEAGYVWDERRIVAQAQLRMPKKDGYFDHCLHGDTRVFTKERGEIRIRDLVGLTGHVLSKDGAWLRFHSARLTRQQAECVRVVFDDGASVTCTRDHRFWTDCGWIEALFLLDTSCYNGVFQRIQITQCLARVRQWLFKSFKGSDTTCAATTTNAQDSDSTAWCGLRPTVQSQWTSTFTIRMATGLTTDWRTWNYSRATLTSPCTAPNAGRRGSPPLPQSPDVNAGTLHQPDARGIWRTIRRMPTIFTSAARLRAFNAARSTRDKSTARTPTVRRSATPPTAVRLVWTIKNGCVRVVARVLWLIATRNSAIARDRARNRVLAIEPAGRHDVYCLTVPGVHAFAIANGVIVANSQNCTEYSVLGYGPVTADVIEQGSSPIPPRPERDYDPADRGRVQATGRRGGYRR